MALSNKFGHMLLTTGNKSELAVGYCTLYGDMNGGLGVIADVPENDGVRTGPVHQRERKTEDRKSRIPDSASLASRKHRPPNFARIRPTRTPFRRTMFSTRSSNATSKRQNHRSRSSRKPATARNSSATSSARSTSTSTSASKPRPACASPPRPSASVAASPSPNATWNGIDATLSNNQVIQSAACPCHGGARVTPCSESSLPSVTIFNSCRTSFVFRLPAFPVAPKRFVRRPGRPSLRWGRLPVGDRAEGRLGLPRETFLFRVQQTVGPLGDRDGPFGIRPHGQARDAKIRGLLLNAARISHHECRPCFQRDKIQITQRLRQHQSRAPAPIQA